MHHQLEGVNYIHIDKLDELSGEFDLCYTNGVFHHIPPDQRTKALSSIYNSMKLGGYFCFFENNPFNPGTRYVMNKVPFDKDAVTIKYKEGIKMLETSGFKALNTDFLFYFPKSLGFLRFIESSLEKLPLGGQYHIFTQKVKK